MKKVVKAAGTMGLVALAVIANPSAMADNSGFYGGINLGQSRANIDDKRIAREMLSGGFTTTSIKDDDEDIGFKIFGGYQFNEYFAIEGGYFDLGEFEFKATTVPAGTLNGRIELKGVNLDAVGILPITDKFSAFARVGVIYAEAEDSFKGTGLVTVTNPHPSKWDANYKFGAGVQSQFTEALGVRAEAERYRINDAVGNDGDIDLFSVGEIYRFWKTLAPAPVAVAPEPVRVAAAPPPEPVAPPPPPEPERVGAEPEPVVVPPPAPMKVTFSADSLFDFDKAIVKPAGRQALDQFATDLKGADFEVISVTGHTDRIGSHAYNMELSTRRAEAVKAYLVESAGIPADKITAIGTDGSDPVTKPEDCIGHKATKKLIACLQPDRRVEVEVSGTR